jgi:phosphoglycerate dehydrogenase-like enzyme
MPPPVVLVTESEFRKAETVFTSAVDLTCRPAPSGESELSRAIAASGARHVVAGHTRYESTLYAALPRGGVLARFGVGHEGIDKARATQAGLLCTNTPGVLDQSVAELTMLLIAGAARHLPTVAGGMLQGEWRPRLGMELHGKTLAIVGCGRIGAAVARIAARGFGMRVVGFRRARARSGGPAVSPDFDEVTDDFAAAVRGADFVSLHIPAAPENFRFINRDRLSMLGSHAWLINTARGAVVDEAALYDAVAGERIGGAALDVFVREPYEPIDADHDLRTLSRVVLTPHVGSNTPEANHAIGGRALRNIRLAEAGDFAAMDLLNPEVLGAL